MSTKPGGSKQLTDPEESALYYHIDRACRRPKPFEHYTAADLWTDDYVSSQMLRYHLDESVDLASRNHAFIDRSVEWIVSHFNLDENSAVIDIGCGPGLYTTRFAERGINVTGVDFSKRSIDYARKTALAKKLSIEYINQDYLVLATERKFDLITMIFCDFCPLSQAQRQHLLGIFKNLLKEDGRILLDVFSHEFLVKKEDCLKLEFFDNNGFWSPETHYVIQNSIKYDSDKLSLDKYTITDKMRFREIYNWLQCYSPESIAGEFAVAGLRIVEKFANVAGDPFDKALTEFAIAAELGS